MKPLESCLYLYAIFYKTIKAYGIGYFLLTAASTEVANHFINRTPIKPGAGYDGVVPLKV